MAGRILVDVTGLLSWYAYFRQPSGIQRVTEQLLASSAIQSRPKVEFVARVLGSDSFIQLDARTIASLAELRDRSSAIARLRRTFAQSMTYAGASGLKHDWRSYHAPYFLAGFLRVDGLVEAIFNRGRTQRRRRPQIIDDPVYDDILFGPGDYWCHATYVDALIRLKQRTGVRLVQMIHDLFALTHPEWTNPGFAQAIISQFHKLAPHVDRWVATSHFVAGELETYLKGRGLPVRPIDLVPPGWDCFAMAPPAGASRDRDVLHRHGVGSGYILHVGTIEPRKNITTLLDALQELRQRRNLPVPPLLLVGRDGWRSDEVRERLARTNNESGTVRWLKSVSDEDLPAFYRQAVLSVVPSFAEGWGLPVQESVFYGTPCIAARVGGIPEVGRDHVVYFNPLERRELVAALEQQLANSSATLLPEGRSRPLNVKTLPTWEDSARKLVDLLENPASEMAGR